MSVLVTGVSGLVGVNAALALVKRGETVIGVSRNGLSSLGRETLGTGLFKEERCDVRDFERLLCIARENNVTRVVHTAGIAGSSKSASDPLSMTTINLTGTANVLEVARRLNVLRVVYTSTSSVYGPRPDGKHIREEEVSPRSLYGEVKWMAEVLAARYTRDFGLSTVAARLFSVYGPFQKPGDLDVGYGVIHHLCDAALNHRPVRLKAAGNYFRGYTFVEDVADGLCRLLFAPKLSCRAYNLASGRSYTLTEVAAAIRKSVPDADFELGSGSWVDGPPAATLRGPLDITRAREDLGFEPKHTLEEGIALYLDYLRRLQSLDRSR